MRAVTALPILAALCGIGACSQSVTLVEPFPAPLVEPLALDVAVHYPVEFSTFVHRETSGGRDWAINLGTSNERMFNAVFAGLFARMQQVSSVAAAPQEMPGLDAIVSVGVDAFEFALPHQSAADQYAVWIRYTLTVYDARGAELLRWSVSAYGQSGTEGLSDRESMQRAILLALRDAEAAIALGFPQQQAIRTGLLGEAASDAS